MSPRVEVRTGARCPTDRSTQERDKVPVIGPAFEPVPGTPRTEPPCCALKMPSGQSTGPPPRVQHLVPDRRGVRFGGPCRSRSSGAGRGDEPVSARAPSSSARLSHPWRSDTFLALGGSTYAPAACATPARRASGRRPRTWRGSRSSSCSRRSTAPPVSLDISRETLAVALATPSGREASPTTRRLEDAVRAGVERAIDDGESAGAISGVVATGLRALARNAPMSR